MRERLKTHRDMNPPSTKWLKPPDDLALEANEAHVWRISLESERSFIGESLKLLSAGEKIRAGKFHFQKDRDRFVLGRAAVRKILSSYLDVLPGEICFSYSKFGKPALAPEKHENLLRFNLAHSRDTALLAVTKNIDVGIDIEYIDEQFPFAKIAPDCFSPAELAALNSVSLAARALAFFSGWTRKEAFIKAVGEGLSYPLREFTVSLDPGKERDLLISNDPAGIRHRALISLAPGPHHAAALAAMGAIDPVRCFEWQRCHHLSSSLAS
jgi:4'-phosphopantetheinyl transferase